MSTTRKKNGNSLALTKSMTDCLDEIEMQDVRDLEEKQNTFIMPTDESDDEEKLILHSNRTSTVQAHSTNIANLDSNPDYELVGGGEFADVYRLKNQPIESQPIAIKAFKLPQGVTNMKEFIEDVENEIEAMKFLSKNNVPHVINYISSYCPKNFDQGLPQITMEYVSRGSIGAMIERGDFPLSWHICVRIMDQVLTALIYLHKGGWLHRDIKPDNILLDGEFNAKLADFGFAIKQPYERGKQTLGTPGYEAPEILSFLLSGKNDRCVNTEKTDTFAVAITFWELLAWMSTVISFVQKNCPDKDLNDPAVFFKFIHATVNGERPDITKIDPQFRKLITDGWTQDPQKRATASQMKNELESIAVQPAKTAPKFN